MNSQLKNLIITKISEVQEELQTLKVKIMDRESRSLDVLTQEKLIGILNEVKRLSSEEK